MEFNIKLKKGMVLRGMISSPGKHIRAVVIFIHGLGEHIQRYSHWYSALNNKGIGFTGVDLPGHGLSDGSRGNISSYDLTDEMIEILYESVKNTFTGIPVFLYGHSLGGGIVTDYLIRKNLKLRGAVVTSPWLKLSFEPDRFKVILASLIRKILPGLSQPSGLVTEHLSHDNLVVEAYRSDPLVHDRISVSLYYNAMKAAENSLEHAADLRIPLLLMHGSEDMISSPEGSRQFASASKTTELKIWDGGYHELHNESFRDEVFEYLFQWIDKKID